MAMLAGDKFKSHGVGAVHGILIATRRAKTSMATKRNEFQFTTFCATIHGTTGDLDTEVAQDVANGHLIIGMSAQMPYDQGEELAYAVANVLLGKRVSKVIGVEPLLVTAANLEEAWYVMTKEKAPQSIVNSLTETRKKEKMRIEKNSKWKTK